jgi:small subunit ribosomal protein S4
MGHPRKSRKQYNTPSHPWNAERIKEENKLMLKYGLKNKKEIWKADTLVRKYSREARYLLGFSSDQIKEEKNELVGHLSRLGILNENAHLEDILNLTVEDVLRRRLQTMVHQKGFSRTAKEARLFVVHGHIAMNGKKINSPSFAVKRGEEELIGFYSSSPVAKQIEEYNKREPKVKEKSEDKSSNSKNNRNRSRRRFDKSRGRSPNSQSNKNRPKGKFQGKSGEKKNK